MAFEIYYPRGEKQPKNPEISLSKTSIVLNKIARTKLDSRRIELAYDREENIIRIKSVSEGGVQIKKTKVFGKGFFKQFGINKKGRYSAIYDGDQKALYVKIS